MIYLKKVFILFTLSTKTDLKDMFRFAKSKNVDEAVKVGTKVSLFQPEGWLNLLGRRECFENCFGGIPLKTPRRSSKYFCRVLGFQNIFACTFEKFWISLHFSLCLKVAKYERKN